MFQGLNQRGSWIVALAAAGILTVTMGIRQSSGLFLSPLNTATGLGVASISLAFAISQFAWGAIQPIAGALSDRYGPAPVLAMSLLVLALGMAITPFMDSSWGLIISLGILAATGSGGGSFSVLIGAAAQRLPPEARGSASGLINAGGSFGQFVFAPLVQRLIHGIGWMGAMWSMAIIAIATLPLVRTLCRQPLVTAPAAMSSAPEQRLGQAVGAAMRDRNYLLLSAGFFTCGFHIAFLVTHLPEEVALCGLPPSVASWSLAIIGLANIVGSLYAGGWVGQYRSKHILFWMYGSRAVLIALYLLSPKTALTFYLFAAGLGFTWLATVPPTAALIGKLHGVRFIGTLFGISLLSHQMGGFLGAWLGGIAVTQQGDYTWMWYADMALAALAALINLPIREQPVVKARAATAS